jgi:hypothetical protein
MPADVRETRYIGGKGLSAGEIPGGRPVHPFLIPTSNRQGIRLNDRLDLRNEIFGQIMFNPLVKIVFLLVLSSCVVPGCAQLKETGRTIGHTTRDVTRAIGHGTRDAAKAVGEGVKKVVKSASEDES